MSLNSVHGLQYVCFALAVGRKIRCSFGDLRGWVGAHTMWDLILSFFNGIPYMTESDKRRTPSVYEVSLARLLGSASWVRPGAPLSGQCWGCFSESSASVVCACRWQLGDREKEQS